MTFAPCCGPNRPSGRRWKPRGFKAPPWPQNSSARSRRNSRPATPPTPARRGASPPSSSCPPGLRWAEGEITDKGYINQSAVLANYASLVEELYGSMPAPAAMTL